MDIVFAMILSIGIKGVSAIVEIAIQMLITNGVGVSEYGDYTFFVSLIEGAYFLLFSGSIKLNTFYLSTPSASLSKFKKKYTLCFVTPIIAAIIAIFALMKNPYGILAGVILYIYYFAFDTSSVFFSSGKQLPALLGEYLFGRVVLLIGMLVVIRLNAATGLMLLTLYGLQFVTMLLWFAPHKGKLTQGTSEVEVPIKKLMEYQMSDVANSLISYAPTILQYVIGGAFSAGFTGIISIVKRFINFISGPTAKVFLPEFSRLYKSGQQKELEQSYLMIVRIQMVFIGTIGTALIGFPHLILKLFSPELLQYSTVFTLAACCLLLVAGIGPVTGMLQMTGSEKICNRNQWISIGVMVLVWIVLRKEPLFAVYGLCVQAVIEGGLKYYSVCKWFGKNIVPIKNYILLWLPVKADLNTGRQELKDTKDTLNKRMDSIVGNRTSNAEVLDARVDADGKTHENLGAHIRSGFESARADQEEAVNRIGRMAAVSDAMRTANMVHTVDFSASNTSGEVKATAVSLGHGDRAGAVINGALKEGENDVSVLRFTEPMAFKAGTPYTVFIDETNPKVGYGIYFYEVGTGTCLQVGGINRGFTPANAKIATAVFDNGGMFRAGIYSTNCEFENHELHLYVVEGEYTQRDFFGLPTVADVSNNSAAMSSVRDEVRKNNLVVMKQVILKNEEDEPLWTSTPVGALNLGATVLNGQLGPTAGTYAVQISSPFMLDKEKDYTLFLLDERKDLEYSVYLLDETTWKDVMENGVTRAFDVIHSPCGVIPAHSTGKHQLRIWAQQDTLFDNRAIQVYLVEGKYTENELRTHLPAKEASAAVNGLIDNLNALNRVGDTLRRNNMVRTIDFTAVGSDELVCATAKSLGVASGTVISGSLGSKQGRNTLYFGESIWLDRTKKYTLYVRSDESMPSCDVYFYGNSKSGCMQVDGINKGFSVHGIMPVTFTPDESCYYRPGIYTSQDLEFPNCEMHLFVLEGVYTYDTVRGLVEFNDLNGSFTSLAAVHDSVRVKNLFRTVNYGDSNSQTNAKIQMIADSDIDQASVKIVGNMGGTLALNSIRCTALVPLTSGKTYTLLVREDEDCPSLTVLLGDEVTYGSIQINGAAVSVNTKNRHAYSFTADKDYSCRARIVCDTATNFTGQHIRVYLVEGSYTEEQMRSWAEYSELLQVKADADQKIQVLSNREDARWFSTHNGLENILTVSDRARMNNMVKTIDSAVRSNAGDVSATATALGVLDGAGIIVNGLMSSELNATILRISEPMHLEKGKTYTVHIVDDDPPAPYSMFFYRTTSSACLQQGGTNRGVSAIGSRFEQVIPDATGDYQMGIYATGAVFSSHMIHAYMYEGEDWSAEDFYAYPKSDTLAAVVSEMAAVKDEVRKKNLVRMISNKGFRDGTGIYRLSAVGMPDPAGLVLNGSFGTASTTTYSNISEVFHLEAGQTYSILVRDTDKTMDYNISLIDKTTGASVKQDGAALAFNVQRSPFGNFVPDASQDVRLRINYRKAMTVEDHALHVYVLEGKYSLTDMLAFAQEKEEEPEEDTGFPYESYSLPILKLTGSMKGISKANKVKLTYSYGELSGGCSLKWQGASSIAYDKKNFTITFDEPQTIVENWGTQKKYCLKANYVDFSHCRNIVAAKLWGQAVRSRSKRNDKLYGLPNGGAIDGFPIMLAINGEYQGIYTFNIPKDKWMFGMTDGARECILTAETHAKGTQFAEEAKVDATDFEMEYVPDEENTQWVKDSVNTLIRAVMNFSGTTAAEVDSALSPYLDIESAVDYFIITCMFALTDNLDKNYILMTFDGVKWAFSEYDLDTAFGNRWDGKTYYSPDTVTTFKSFANTHKLMGILYSCYKDKLKARYAALRKNVLSEANIQMTVANFLVDIPKGLLDQEVVLWPKIPGTNTNNMSQILNWYRLRCIAMDAEINAL